MLKPLPVWTTTNCGKWLKICPGCSLERLMLKMKLQYFSHFMRRVDSLEKTLMMGRIGGRRRRGRQRMRWLDGITDSMDMSWVNSGSWWWTGRPGVLRFMESQRVGHDWVTELNCIPYHLTWLLRNPYAGQEATVRIGHGTKDWFQIGKGVGQCCMFPPCLFNLYAQYIMWNAWLDAAQARIKTPVRNINNLRYADDTTLMAESEEEPRAF